MKVGDDHHASVNSAITEVLNAERTAVAQIEACEERANQIMKDARRFVRAMVRRTQRRISGLHSGCAARRRELVAEIERDAARDAIRSAPDLQEVERVLAAVHSVARALTTPQSSDGD